MGTSASKKVRAAGQIPAILYGHGEANVALAISKEELDAAIRHGSQVVKLEGDVSQDAFIRDVQWDPFGVDVLHVDFTRISAGESVETSISIELRGVAPGASAGGVVEQNVHDLQVDCPAMRIPDKLEVNVNELEIGQSITAADVALPEGAKLLTPPDMVVVSCTEVQEQEELEGEGAIAASNEPEVIGRKEEEEGGE